MYIIFKVCLEYYLYIKFNNKKKLVLFTSTSSFKEYVKTTWSKKCLEWQNLIACVQ